jgi:hypothetical protein
MSNPNTRPVAQEIRGNHSFVNKTVTSGLPIGSICQQFLLNE